VNYDSLVGVLVEAVKEQDVKLKEQQAERESLAATVRDLQQRNESLEKRLLALEAK
jgi:hypothetical protein